MKRFLLFWIILSIILAAPAQERNASNNNTNDHSQIGRETHVTANEARAIGLRFLNANSSQTRGLGELQMATAYRTTQGDTAFYVFNTANGFVMVSADRRATPILGYSDEGAFDENNVPIQMQSYLQGFVEQIAYGIGHPTAVDATTEQQWDQVRTTGQLTTSSANVARGNNLVNTAMENNRMTKSVMMAKDSAGKMVRKEVSLSDLMNGTAENSHIMMPTLPKNNRGSRSGSNGVAPLITANWDQSCYYNALCPTDADGICGHTPTGCVATAMGMIMRYWGYPAQGTGTHSYTPDGYPEQTVNFGTTTYDWDNMPDQLDENSTQAQVDAVSTLLWHCGVAVDMVYGAYESFVSIDPIQYALATYFNYAGSFYFEARDNDSVWLSHLKESLDLGHPLLYFATDSIRSESHAFVCDGYNSGDLLHFNWGWSGNGNGYFAIGALDVPGYQFNCDNLALFNFYPPSEFQLCYKIIEGGAEVTYSKVKSCPDIGYDYLPDSLIIPPSITIDGVEYPVIAIGDSAFQGCSFHQSTLHIPNTVKTIGARAFDACYNLSYCDLPNSVTEIKHAAFIGAGLTSINLPDSLTTIGSWAFSWCNNLTSITFPRSLTTIGHSFCAISSIDTINWNADSCVMIHEGFFWYLDISTLNLGEHVRYLPEMAFAGSAFPSVTLPESLIYIGSNCFNTCYNLTSLTIPSNVLTIEDCAFYGCTSLSVVYMQPLMPPFINGNVFDHNADGRIFFVPCGTWDAYYSVLGWCTPGSLIREPGDVNLELTVVSNDSIMGDVEIIRYPSSCDSTVIIVAHANYGYHFDYWNNGYTENPLTFTITSDTSFMAFFAADKFDVTGVAAKSIFHTNFEEPQNDTLWTLKNQNYVNQWYINNIDSTNRFMFISDDNGLTNSYTNENAHSYVFAYHPFYLRDGDYLYSFDYRVDGYGLGGQWTLNEFANDCMFFFLSKDDIDSIPISYYGNDSTLCLGYDIVDQMLFDDYLDVFYGQPEWSNHSTSIHIPSEGIYNLGFYWRNGDDIYGNGPLSHQETRLPNGYPAAVDNILFGILDTIRGYVIGAGNVDYLDTATITAVANPGYHFVCWYDCDTNITKQVVVTGDLNCVAYFDAEHYSVVVNSSDTLSGTVSGGGIFGYSEECTIIATPAEGYHFFRWSDGNTDNPRTITVTQDTSFTAIFAACAITSAVESVSANESYLWADSLYTASGIYEHTWTTAEGCDSTVSLWLTITKTQYDTTYIDVHDTTYVDIHDTTYIDVYVLLHDTTYVTLTDTIVFNLHDTTYVTVHDTITVTEQLTWYSLQVLSADLDKGVAAGSGQFPEGTDVEIAAVPIEGNRFLQWSDGSEANPRTVTVDGDLTLTALFTTVGVADLALPTWYVYPEQGAFVVKGAGGHQVSVYDAAGKLLHRYPNAPDILRYSVPASGSYLIQVDNGAAKKVPVVR